MESRAASLVTAGEILSKTHGLNFNLSKQKFVRTVRLKNLPDILLSDICVKIFRATQKEGLAERRSDIVNRRGTSLNPLSSKLCEDICLACNKPVKRVMYRGGKRGVHCLESA